MKWGVNLRVLPNVSLEKIQLGTLSQLEECCMLNHVTID